MSAISRAALAAAAILTTLLLQASFIGPLTFPTPVSLPTLMVVVVGIYAGPGIGMSIGFATGLLADLGSDHPAGVQALCWLAAGLLAGKFGGLATERGYGVRGVAALAAGISALTGTVVASLLAVLGSHAATVWLALRDTVPIALVDALLGLLVVPAVRRMLAAQGIQAPRPRAELISRSYAID